MQFLYKNFLEYAKMVRIHIKNDYFSRKTTDKEAGLSYKSRRMVLKVLDDIQETDSIADLEAKLISLNGIDGVIKLFIPNPYQIALSTGSSIVYIATIEPLVQLPQNTS